MCPFFISTFPLFIPQPLFALGLFKYISIKVYNFQEKNGHSFGLCPCPGFYLWNLMFSLCSFFPRNKVFVLFWSLWTPKSWVFVCKNYIIYWWVLPDIFHWLVCFPITWKNSFWVAPFFHLIGSCHSSPSPTMTNLTRLLGGLLM